MIKNFFLLTLAVCFLALTGCTGATPQVSTEASDQPAAGGQPAGADGFRFDLNAQPVYESNFQIQFTGSQNWKYAVQTRRSATLTEVSMQIEGVEGQQNPGDIRMVTDGTTTWMTGEGTDNECVQFPNGAGMDPVFLDPESLLTSGEMEKALKLASEETSNGVALRHYQASGAQAGAWQNTTMDLWTERDSGMLLRFKLEGSGEDPFFGTGTGKVAANYSAQNLTSDVIAPVEGCELPVPLPDSAFMLVKLPGMASFDTAEMAGAVSAFYQTALPQEGWTLKETPAQTEGISVLSYYNETQVVEVHIEALSGGSRVKLLFLPTQ